MTSEPNLMCDLLSPPTSIDDVINDVITREVGECELYTRVHFYVSINSIVWLNFSNPVFGKALLFIHKGSGYRSGESDVVRIEC